MPDVYDIRQMLVDELHDENFVTDKSGVKTIEIVNAAFLANEDAIFCNR